MKRHHMHIGKVSRKRYAYTLVWAMAVCVTIMVVVAMIGRASVNINAALLNNPDLAVPILLPDEGIVDQALLRELEFERDYMVETSEGPKFVKIRKVDGMWKVVELETLHE